MGAVWAGSLAARRRGCLFWCRVKGLSSKADCASWDQIPVLESDVYRYASRPRSYRPEVWKKCVADGKSKCVDEWRYLRYARGEEDVQERSEVREISRLWSRTFSFSILHDFSYTSARDDDHFVLCLSVGEDVLGAPFVCGNTVWKRYTAARGHTDRRYGRSVWPMAKASVPMSGGISGTKTVRSCGVSQRSLHSSNHHTFAVMHS